VIKIADGKDGCKTKFHTSYHINCNVFFVLIKSLKTKKKKKVCVTGEGAENVL
jgi:hypothetical protein